MAIRVRLAILIFGFALCQRILEKVYKVITEFGAPVFDLQIDDLCKPGNVFQIGIAPRRIDILTSISGVEFADAYRDQFIVELDGMKLPFLSLENLIKNKEKSGRPKDLEDVKELKNLL